MSIQPVKVSGVRVILSWKQSKAEDVVGYRLYTSTEGSVSYDSPYCSIPKPPGNRPSIRYNLVECNVLEQYTGEVLLAVASVDDASNVSDLSPSIELFIDFNSIWAKLYKVAWDAVNNWKAKIRKEDQPIAL